MEPKSYLAIDLKSFYASVECMERGLNPMDHQSGGSGFVPHRKDHLPGGDALPSKPMAFPAGPGCSRWSSG